MTQPSPTVRLNDADNVVVARKAIAADIEITGEKVRTTTAIPAGHKIATKPIARGEPVRRYGQIIGFASSDIAPGDHVHVQNVEMQDFERDYAVGQDARPLAMVPEADRDTFRGFVRPSGKVGTRNYIGILSSVNCSASVCKFIQQTFPQEVLADFPGVDGVVALTHSTGCGMADRGRKVSPPCSARSGHARHPNFAGILMIGLGCEVNQIDFLLEAYSIKRVASLFQHMTMRGTGARRKTIERAVGMRIREMLPHAAEAKRETVHASELSVALQCGGSDAYSGITANPALGYATDLLAAQGGTGGLAETPEIYGAEHLLTRRASKPEVAKLIERIKCRRHRLQRRRDEQQSVARQQGGRSHHHSRKIARCGGQGRHHQPQPGAQICRACHRTRLPLHGQPPATIPSVTGQVASGANIVAFTTGRGPLLATSPHRRSSFATNTMMYERMEEDMDINCGDILSGDATIESKGREILDTLLKVASGEKSKSEALGIGDHEFIPWQIGAVM
ncbi:MAG: altronate dehydratase family protein [Geminicoccaceae bacterium]